MASGNNGSGGKRRFKLCEHPWLSLVAVTLTSVIAILLSGTVIFGLIGLPDPEGSRRGRPDAGEPVLQAAVSN